MGTSWEVTQQKVQAAVEKIIETAHPRQIIREHYPFVTPVGALDPTL
jgi:hypothetical protein